jgi:hypothetical protein
MKEILVMTGTEHKYQKEGRIPQILRMISGWESITGSTLKHIWPPVCFY